MVILIYLGSNFISKKLLTKERNIIFLNDTIAMALFLFSDLMYTMEPLDSLLEQLILVYFFNSSVLKGCILRILVICILVRMTKLLFRY